MGLGVSGLMSGLDTDSIISKLMELERRPVVLLQRKEAGYQAKITAIGMVKSAMSELKSAVEGLKDSEDFLSYRASSSNTDILTVSAGDEVLPGVYNITVSHLASAQQVRSSAFSGSDAAIGTGKITIQVGNNEPVEIEITSENNTLAGIAQAINDAEAGVTAGIINDGNGSYYLTLQSQNTGADNTISFSVQDDDGNNNDNSGLSAIYADPAAETLIETQSAANAQLVVNGIDVERSSNEIDDLISGMTLTLKSADSSKSVTITSSKDYEGITSKLDAFVEKYNALVDLVKEQTAYNASTDQAGTLLGDSTVSRINSGLSKIVYHTVKGIDQAVNRLSKLGIELEESGHLSLDKSKLTAAMEEHPDDVSMLFASDEDGNKGVAVKFYDFLDGYLKGSTGILAAKTSGLEKSIEGINDQIEQIETRLSKREENLRHQFESLENLLSEFQMTSGQLEQQLMSIANLNSYISRKK